MPKVTAALRCASLNWHRAGEGVFGALPDGHGSVTCCKYTGSLLSRAPVSKRSSGLFSEPDASKSVNYEPDDAPPLQEPSPFVDTLGQSVDNFCELR